MFGTMFNLDLSVHACNMLPWQILSSVFLGNVVIACYGVVVIAYRVKTNGQIIPVMGLFG